MRSDVVVNKLVRKVENVGFPVLFSICSSLLLFALSFRLTYEGGHPVLVPLLMYLAMLALIFTKSKSFGSHTARLSAVFALCCFSRIFSFVIPEGESRWYGDCWISDGGSLEIEAFLSALLAYVVYFIVKSAVRKKFLLDRDDKSVSSSVPSCTPLCVDSISFFSRAVLFLDKLKLPRNFGLGLFVICVLGHIFFGFTNAHLYNASLYYSNPEGIKSAVGGIFSWHVMDVALFFVSILVGILFLRVKYSGARFVRFFTFFVFCVLNLTLGYFYSHNVKMISLVFGSVAFVYVLSRFVFLRFLVNKNNGTYGV